MQHRSGSEYASWQAAASRRAARRRNRPKAVPEWDAQRRELRVGGCVVKRFRQPAPDQETILAAFEELHWPPCIDDPLSPRPGDDPKRRLHKTIENLNRSQKGPLVRFHGSGNGKGIMWEIVE